jgi:nucleoside-diphosphate-sugar epimerase
MILLTGASGFLGSHILSSLLEKNYSIAITLRHSSDLSRIKHHLNNTFLTTVFLEEVNLQKFFEQNKVSTIIHTATNYGRGVTPFQDVLKSNLTFPLELLELALKNGVTLFVNTDSYFNKINHSYFTLPAYSLSKRNFLDWLKYYSDKMNIVNMQLEHLYGPNDAPSKFTENLINAVAVDTVASYALTSGNQIRDFIFVTDATSAYVRVLENIDRNLFGLKNYEVGTGYGTSIKEFAEKVKDLSLSKTELQFGRLDQRPDEIEFSTAANEDLLKLGWYPRVDIADGISQIIKHSKSVHKDSSGGQE